MVNALKSPWFWWGSISLLVFIGSIVTLIVVENSKQSRKDKDKTTNVANVVLTISVISGLIYAVAFFLQAGFREIEVREIEDMPHIPDKQDMYRSPILDTSEKRKFWFLEADTSKKNKN